jgi:hypothetical protein
MDSPGGKSAQTRLQIALISLQTGSVSPAGRIDPITSPQAFK